MQSIVLINCFFGEFPWYFPFFIKSCTTNPTVDFIIFSDRNYNMELPQNVSIISLTMVDFNNLASSKLNIDINIKTPYKLCDFKPAYGVIFSDYLLNYDFWGMCDLDIILGRIREFMTPELLHEYDVISTRHDYITGWFMLFKNTKKINTLFMKSKDYKKVFTSNTHYCFDECNFKHLQLDDNALNILDISCEIDSMEHLIQKELKEKRINVFFDLIMVDGLCGKMKWNNGVLTYNNNFEILLYHLIRYKANQYSQKTFWVTVPDLFYIDKYVFRKKTIASVIGFYNYFYFNKINPSILKIVQPTKFFISNLFIGKITIGFQNGMYKNQHEDLYLWICENHISFYEQENHANQLIPSKFENDLFYIKNHSSLRCRYFAAKNGMLPKIQLIRIDGSIINYELKTENKE